MRATFAFDVCHDVYRAAREAIDMKIPTLNAEASGKYQWRPDRMPRLAEYVCDFARAGERALGGNGGGDFSLRGGRSVAGAAMNGEPRYAKNLLGRGSASFDGKPQTEVCATRPFRASRMAMFRVYYLGGADYQAARRHLGISELTWADWAEEIRKLVGRELTRAGVFPPSKYFREATAKAS
jgi:hypothetical protein